MAGHPYHGTQKTGVATYEKADSSSLLQFDKLHYSIILDAEAKGEPLGSTALRGSFRSAPLGQR